MTSYNELRDGQELYADGDKKGYEDAKKAFERPTGKWIEYEEYNGDVYYECSACREPWCTIEGTPTDNMMNYCPHCGARMDSIIERSDDG